MEPQEDKEAKGPRWVWTSYDIGMLPVLSAPAVYIIYQGEVCPDTGRQHMQGYVRFSKVQRWVQVGEWFSQYSRKPVWHKLAKGTEEQNKSYCTKTVKDGKPMEVWLPTVEYGEYKSDAGKQGKRTDLLSTCEAIAGGATPRDIAEQFPTTFVKYHAGLEKFRETLKPPPEPFRDLDVQVLWGDTATGKSHRVRTKYPDAYIVVPGRYPFDQYSDETVVVFEEFDWTQWNITDMNRYLDKWKCPLQCRYNNKYAKWTKVFILANTHPGDWYGNVPHRAIQEAFNRRLTITTLVVDQAQEIQLL